MSYEIVPAGDYFHILDARRMRIAFCRSARDANFIKAALELAEISKQYDGDNRTHTGSCLKGEFTDPPDCPRCKLTDVYGDAVDTYKKAKEARS